MHLLGLFSHLDFTLFRCLLSRTTTLSSYLCTLLRTSFRTLTRLRLTPQSVLPLWASVVPSLVSRTAPLCAYRCSVFRSFVVSFSVFSLFRFSRLYGVRLSYRVAPLQCTSTASATEPLRRHSDRSHLYGVSYRTYTAILRASAAISFASSSHLLLRSMLDGFNTIAVLKLLLLNCYSNCELILILVPTSHTAESCTSVLFR